MNSRLAKEFRPLLFPWCVAAVAAFGYPIELYWQGGRGSLLAGLASFISGLGGLAFVTGSLFLATMPFGSEFHQRTWPLLLGQPIERLRLWKEKMLVATVAVVGLAVVHGAILAGMGKLPADTLLPAFGFLVATICSAGLGALAARSVIGGMVFVGTAQFAMTLAVTGVIYACYKALGQDAFDPAIDPQPVLATFIGAGMAYSAISLSLGWRKFSELQVRDAPASADVALPQWITPKSMATLLRPQPAGSLRNLICKELGLQKPVFTIGVAFTACWLLTLLLFVLQPARREIFVGILNGMTVVHIAIVVLLAGCVSLGEEKTLGLAAWHLTLPVSSFRQWLVKLLVAAATVVVVGLVLPMFLSLIALVKAEVGLAALQTGDFAQTALVLGIMLMVGVLSFWSATFTTSTVQAALTTVATCVGLFVSAAAAFWTEDRLGGFQTGLFKYLAVRFQLPPHFFYSIINEHEALRLLPFIGLGLLLLAVALTQSFRCLRRAQAPQGVPWRQPLCLLLVICPIILWLTDLKLSVQLSSANLNSDMFHAFESLRLRDSELPAPHQTRKVTLKEFLNADQLSVSMKRWLKDVTIGVQEVSSTNSGQLRYCGRVYFHNGLSHYLGNVHPQTPPD